MVLVEQKRKPVGSNLKNIICTTVSPGTSFEKKGRGFRGIRAFCSQNNFVFVGLRFSFSAKSERKSLQEMRLVDLSPRGRKHLKGDRLIIIIMKINK